MSTIPPTGWAVEVDHPDGVTRTPTVLEDAVARPTLNGRPEVVIPVRKREHWTRDVWDRQPMRVWRDGQRLPIEEVAAVRERADRVELVGHGGQGLGKRYEGDIQDEPVHEALRTILETTSYGVTVDPAPVAQNTTWETLTSDSDFQTFATDSTDPPLQTIGGAFEPAQTAYFEALSNVTIVSGTLQTNSSHNWSNDQTISVALSGSDTLVLELTIDLDYEIPADRLKVATRGGTDFTGNVEARRDSDDTPLANLFRSATTGRSGSQTVEWQDWQPDPDGVDPTLGPGSVQINIFVNDGGDTAAGDWLLDCPVVYDSDFWTFSNFSNTLDSNTLIDGPPGRYAPVDVDFDATPVLRSEGARLEATLSSTVNGQALGLSPDGDSFTTSANTATFETDFGDDTANFVARVTLGGVDASSNFDDVESELTRYRMWPQNCLELVIKYDALDSPGVDEALDDSVQNLLTQLADRANLLWELQWDGSGISVEVAQAGQRTSDADPSVAEYEAEKDASREISAATVYGSSQTVQDESITADVGNAVQLRQSHIQGDSEFVSPASGFADYERGEDYEMGYTAGEITVLSDGDIADGDSLEVSYQYLPQATVSRSVGFDNDIVETINSLTSTPRCEQAAQFLVADLDAPVWSATVTIPRDEAGFDLIDEIDPSRLPTPTGGGYRIEGIDESPREVTLQLGSGRSLGEIIQRLESSLSETAREV